MALVITRTRNLLPSIADDFFDGDLLTAPSMFDIDGDLMGSRFLNRVPSVNVIENSNEYRVELAAPGFDKDDFSVEIDDKGVLTISAEEDEEEEEEDEEGYTRREFSCNTFSRSFNLPEDANPDKISAGYDCGILSVTLPKKETTVTSPKKEIKIS